MPSSKGDSVDSWDAFLLEGHQPEGHVGAGRAQPRGAPQVARHDGGGAGQRESERERHAAASGEAQARDLLQSWALAVIVGLRANYTK